MTLLTEQEVGTRLKQLGNYRVRRVQTVALQGPPDGISGATLLALGLRETGLRNVNGGAVKKGDDWVLPEPEHQDCGVFQISRDHHALLLKRLPGVEEGTWGPVVEDRTAFSAGHCPRFEDSLQFTLTMMHEAQGFADSHGVLETDLARFSIAAHNAGIGGAMSGYSGGDVDAHTTYGDYSAWVVHHRTLVNGWLKEHPGWKVT